MYQYHETYLNTESSEIESRDPIHGVGKLRLRNPTAAGSSVIYIESVEARDALVQALEEIDFDED